MTDSKDIADRQFFAKLGADFLKREEEAPDRVITQPYTHKTYSEPGSMAKEMADREFFAKLGADFLERHREEEPPKKKGFLESISDRFKSMRETQRDKQQVERVLDGEVDAPPYVSSQIEINPRPAITPSKISYDHQRHPVEGEAVEGGWTPKYVPQEREGGLGGALDFIFKDSLPVKIEGVPWDLEFTEKTLMRSHLTPTQKLSMKGVFKDPKLPIDPILYMEEILQQTFERSMDSDIFGTFPEDEDNADIPKLLSAIPTVDTIDTAIINKYFDYYMDDITDKEFVSEFRRLVSPFFEEAGFAVPEEPQFMDKALTTLSNMALFAITYNYTGGVARTALEAIGVKGIGTKVIPTAIHGAMSSASATGLLESMKSRPADEVVEAMTASGAIAGLAAPLVGLYISPACQKAFDKAFFEESTKVLTKADKLLLRDIVSARARGVSEWVNKRLYDPNSGIFARLSRSHTQFEKAKVLREYDEISRHFGDWVNRKGGVAIPGSGVGFDDVVGAEIKVPKEFIQKLWVGTQRALSKIGLKDADKIKPMNPAKSIRLIYATDALPQSIAEESARTVYSSSIVSGATKRESAKKAVKAVAKTNEELAKKGALDVFKLGYKTVAPQDIVDPFICPIERAGLDLSREGLKAELLSLPFIEPETAQLFNAMPSDSARSALDILKEVGDVEKPVPFIRLFMTHSEEMKGVLDSLRAGDITKDEAVKQIADLKESTENSFNDSLLEEPPTPSENKTAKKVEGRAIISPAEVETKIEELLDAIETEEGILSTFDAVDGSPGDVEMVRRNIADLKSRLADYKKLASEDSASKKIYIPSPDDRLIKSGDVGGDEIFKRIVDLSDAHGGIQEGGRSVGYWLPEDVNAKFSTALANAGADFVHKTGLAKKERVAVYKDTGKEIGFVYGDKTYSLIKSNRAPAGGGTYSLHLNIADDIHTQLTPGESEMGGVSFAKYNPDLLTNDTLIFNHPESKTPTGRPRTRPTRAMNDELARRVYEHTDKGRMDYQQASALSDFIQGKKIGSYADRSGKPVPSKVASELYRAVRDSDLTLDEFSRASAFIDGENATSYTMVAEPPSAGISFSDNYERLMSTPSKQKAIIEAVKDRGNRIEGKLSIKEEQTLEHIGYMEGLEELAKTNKAKLKANALKVPTEQLALWDRVKRAKAGYGVALYCETYNPQTSLSYYKDPREVEGILTNDFNQWQSRGHGRHKSSLKAVLGVGTDREALDMVVKARKDIVNHQASKDAYQAVNRALLSKIPSDQKNILNNFEGDMAEMAIAYGGGTNAVKAILNKYRELKSIDSKMNSLGTDFGKYLSGIADRYIERGSITNAIRQVGAVVNSPEDLAYKMQIYRSSKESAHFIGIKNGVIVFHEVMSSGLTDGVPISETEVNRVIGLMDTKEVDFAVAVHSHPSGNPTPSAQDEVAFNSLVEADSRFAHNIIINEGKAYHQPAGGRGGLIDIREATPKGARHSGAIADTADLAGIIKNINASEDMAQVYWLSDDQIKGLSLYSKDMFQHPAFLEELKSQSLYREARIVIGLMSDDPTLAVSKMLSTVEQPHIEGFINPEFVGKLTAPLDDIVAVNPDTGDYNSYVLSLTKEAEPLIPDQPYHRLPDECIIDANPEYSKWTHGFELIPADTSEFPDIQGTGRLNFADNILQLPGMHDPEFNLDKWLMKTDEGIVFSKELADEAYRKINEALKKTPIPRKLKQIMESPMRGAFVFYDLEQASPEYAGFVKNLYQYNIASPDIAKNIINGEVLKGVKFDTREDYALLLMAVQDATLPAPEYMRPAIERTRALIHQLGKLQQEAGVYKELYFDRLNNDIDDTVNVWKEELAKLKDPLDRRLLVVKVKMLSDFKELINSGQYTFISFMPVVQTLLKNKQTKLQEATDLNLARKAGEDMHRIARDIGAKYRARTAEMNEVNYRTEQYDKLYKQAREAHSSGDLEEVKILMQKLIDLESSPIEYPTLHKMVSDGTLQLDDIDSVGWLFDYVRDSFRRLGIKDFINYNFRSGLIRKPDHLTAIQNETWVDLDGILSSFRVSDLSGYKVHPLVAEALDTFYRYINPRNHSSKLMRKLDTASFLFKIGQFMYPGMVICYDFIQHTAGGLTLDPRYYTTGLINSYLALMSDGQRGNKFMREKVYPEFVKRNVGAKPEAGLASYDDYKGTLRSLYKPSKGKIPVISQIASDIDRLGAKILGFSLEPSHKEALIAYPHWFTGQATFGIFDPLMRLDALYVAMKQGLEAGEASDLVRVVSGDYSSIVPKFRKFLSRVGFVLQLKFAMTRLVLDTNLDALDGVIYNALRVFEKDGKAPLGAGKRWKQKSRKGKWRLLWQFLIINGFFTGRLTRIIHKHLFKEEDWESVELSPGYRYIVESKAKSGNRPPITFEIGYTSPFNHATRYKYRADNPIPAGKRTPYTLIKSIVFYDLNKLYLALIDLAVNRNRASGLPIVDASFKKEPLKASAQSLEFLLRSMSTFLDDVMPGSVRKGLSEEEERLVKEAMRETLGAGKTMLLESQTIGWIRYSADDRKAMAEKQVHNILSEYRRKLDLAQKIAKSQDDLDRRLRMETIIANESVQGVYMWFDIARLAPPPIIAPRITFMHPRKTTEEQLHIQLRGAKERRKIKERIKEREKQRRK